jgi:hypothetical protein
MKNMWLDSVYEEMTRGVGDDLRGLLGALKILWYANAEFVRLASASFTLSPREHECSYQRPLLLPTPRLLQDTRCNDIF